MCTKESFLLLSGCSFLLLYKETCYCSGILFYLCITIILDVPPKIIFSFYPSYCFEDNILHILNITKCKWGDYQSHLINSKPKASWPWYFWHFGSHALLMKSEAISCFQHLTWFWSIPASINHTPLCPLIKVSEWQVKCFNRVWCEYGHCISGFREKANSE